MTYALFCLLATLMGCGIDYMIKLGDSEDAKFILKEAEEVIEDIIKYDEEPYMSDVHKD